MKKGEYIIVQTKKPMPVLMRNSDFYIFSAHHHLDLIVDSCYRERPFKDENERLEWLLKLYEKMKG